jgi:hypothetical protein
VKFPTLAPLIIPDRIHPTATGHWIMAAKLLAAWRIDPVVSQVAISADETKVIAKNRTTITDLRKTASGIQWTQLDEALPLPLDLDNAMTQLLLGVSDIESLDRQTLRVRNLEPGDYQLLIDKKVVRTFSHRELDKGVNLALLKTPMVDQARGIDWQEDRRATLDQARFILSAETAKTPDPVPAGARLAEAEEELAEKIRMQALPKPHDFELRRR